MPDFEAITNKIKSDRAEIENIKIEVFPVEGEPDSLRGTWHGDRNHTASIQDMLDLFDLSKPDSVPQGTAGKKFDSGLTELQSLESPAEVAWNDIVKLLPKFESFSFTVDPVKETLELNGAFRVDSRSVDAVLIYKSGLSKAYVFAVAVDIARLGHDLNVSVDFPIADAALVLSSGEVSKFPSLLPDLQQDQNHKGLAAVTSFAANYKSKTLTTGIYLVGLLSLSDAEAAISRHTKQRFQGQSTSGGDQLLAEIALILGGSPSVVIQFDYTGTLTARNDKNSISLTEARLRFQFGSTIKLALQASASIKMHGLFDFFDRVGVFHGNELDVLLGADVALGAADISVDFRGIVKAESAGAACAVLNFPPGLWIGDLQFEIGIRNSDFVFGIGATAVIHSTEHQTDFGDISALIDDKQTAVNRFLVVCVLEGDVPKPVYVRFLQSHWQPNEFFTLLTGRTVPEDKAVDAVTDFIMDGGAFRVDSVFGTYAGPTASTLVLPNGKPPTAGGLGIQARVDTFLHSIDAFLFFSIKMKEQNKEWSGIEKLDGGIVIKTAHIPEAGKGITITANPGQGVEMPDIDTSLSLPSSTELGITRLKTSGDNPDFNNPYFKFDYKAATAVSGPRLSVGGDLLITIFNTVKRDKEKSQHPSDAFDFSADLLFELSRTDVEILLKFRFQISLFDALENLATSILKTYDGPLAKPLMALLEALMHAGEKILGAILDPSLDADVALSLAKAKADKPDYGIKKGDEVFQFRFDLNEIGLNDEVKITFKSPVEFRLHDLDVNNVGECIEQFGIQVGKQLWHWFKDDLLEKALEFVGRKLLAAVVYVGKIFVHVAKEEWGAIKDTGTDAVKALEDLFTDPGDLGHDLEKLGTDIAHLAGFSATTTEGVIPTGFNKTYLAPGGQVVLSILDDVTTTRHSYFFFIHKTKSTWSWRVLGRLLNYDESRAKADYQYFRYVLGWCQDRYGGRPGNSPANLACRLYGQPLTLSFKSGDSRVGENYFDIYAATHEHTIITDGSTQHWPAVTTRFVPGRYDPKQPYEDGNVDFPYTAPECGLSFGKRDTPLQEGSLPSEVIDRGQWYIVPALGQFDSEKALEKDNPYSKMVSLLYLMNPCETQSLPRDSFELVPEGWPAELIETGQKPSDADFDCTLVGVDISADFLPEPATVRLTGQFMQRYKLDSFCVDRSQVDQLAGFYLSYTGDGFRLRRIAPGKDAKDRYASVLGKEERWVDGELLQGLATFNAEEADGGYRLSLFAYGDQRDSYVRFDTARQGLTLGSADEATAFNFYPASPGLTVTVQSVQCLEVHHGNDDLYFAVESSNLEDERFVPDNPGQFRSWDLSRGERIDFKSSPTLQNGETVESSCLQFTFSSYLSVRLTDYDEGFIKNSLDNVDDLLGSFFIEFDDHDKVVRISVEQEEARYVFDCHLDKHVLKVVTADMSGPKPDKGTLNQLQELLTKEIPSVIVGGSGSRYQVWFAIAEQRT